MDRHISIGISVEESIAQIAAFSSPEDLEPIDTVKISTTNCFGVDIKSIVQEVVDVRDLYLSEIVGIGLALPGHLNPTATKLLDDENLTDWVGRPLRSTLKRAFPGIPVALGNDAQGRALLEAIANPKLTRKEFILLSMEAGLDAARVIWTGDQPRALPLEWSSFDMKRDFDVRAPKITDIHWLEKIIPWLVPGVNAVLDAYPAALIVLSGSIVGINSSLTTRLTEALASQGCSSTMPEPPVVLKPYHPNMSAIAGAVRLLCNAGVRV